MPGSAARMHSTCDSAWPAAADHSEGRRALPGQVLRGDAADAAPVRSCPSLSASISARAPAVSAAKRRRRTASRSRSPRTSSLRHSRARGRTHAMTASCPSSSRRRRRGPGRSSRRPAAAARLDRVERVRRLRAALATSFSFKNSGIRSSPLHARDVHRVLGDHLAGFVFFFSSGSCISDEALPVREQPLPLLRRPPHRLADRAVVCRAPSVTTPRRSNTTRRRLLAALRRRRPSSAGMCSRTGSPSSFSSCSSSSRPSGSSSEARASRRASTTPAPSSRQSQLVRGYAKPNSPPLGEGGRLKRRLYENSLVLAMLF